MSLEAVAQNLKRLRGVRGLSQKSLAERASVPLSTIKSMEGANGVQSVTTMLMITKALGVRLDDLVQPIRTLEHVRFRSKKRMGHREHVLAEVARWLADFNFFEEILDKPTSFALDDLKGSPCDPILLAGRCRETLGLRPYEPIYDICGLLEDAGVKLLPLPMAYGFYSLSVGKAGGGPAVVVNSWDRIPVERQIFSVAHELGHLMMHHDAYNASEVKEDDKEAKEADSFAEYFLMPNDGFDIQWNNTVGYNLADRVFNVKRIFKVSYKAVLYRLSKTGKADKSVWASFSSECQKKFWLKLSFKEEPIGFDSPEPYGMCEFDFLAGRFNSLAFEALKKELISFGRCAEALRIGLVELKELFAEGGAEP